MSASVPAPGLPGTADTRRLLVATIGAVLLHAALLLGVGLEMPQPRAPSEGLLEVMVVKSPGRDRSPDEAAVAAQADRAADTVVPLPDMEPAPPETEPAPEPREPEFEQALPPEPPTELPTEPPVAAQPAPMLDPIPEPEPQTEPLPEPLTTDPDPQADPLDILAAEPAPQRAPPVSAADILASRTAEIDALAARIDARSSAYAQRVRRKAISTSTREYRYAAYMEAWRRKVERIGNLNYPQEAKRQGLYGNLILHVAVRADGSLEGVRVVRSSGHEVLDQAAVRIVELAAPFAPFPADIKAETDVLDITRTWQFQRNNRLGWDN